MKEQASYPNLFQRVNLYLDDAMTHEDVTRFRNDINCNPSVHQAVEEEKKFRTFLRDNVCRRTASPTLIKMIKDKIRKVSV
jgi:hypothetical protein